jgi:hypothetical protein
MLTVVPRACLRLLSCLFRRADARLVHGAIRNVVIDVDSWDDRRLDVGFTLRDLRRLRTAEVGQHSDAEAGVTVSGSGSSGDAHGW